MLCAPTAVEQYQSNCPFFANPQAHAHLLSLLSAHVVCSDDCMAPFLGHHKTAATLATGCEEKHRRTEAIARLYESTKSFDNTDLSGHADARCHDVVPMLDVRFASVDVSCVRFVQVHSCFAFAQPRVRRRS